MLSLLTIFFFLIESNLGLVISLLSYPTKRYSKTLLSQQPFSVATTHALNLNFKNFVE